MTGVCVVTGGSRGIGAATAMVLARHGWDVAISYRERAEAAAGVVTACRAAGRRAVAVQADVSSETAIHALFETSTAELGQVSGVVNNAGVVPALGRIDSYTIERLAPLLMINVAGAFLVAGEAVRRMSTAHGGRGGA